MKTVEQFVQDNRIRATVEMVDANPNNPDWRYANHYRVKLSRTGSTPGVLSKTLTVYFSQGYGIKEQPTAEAVLDCLASDSVGIENAQSFEDWAPEYGYDTDSRKAEKLFRVCEKDAARLKTFLGDDLYKVLLWETERE